MPPEPNSTATVTTPAIEPTPAAPTAGAEHAPLTLTLSHPVAPIHETPDAQRSSPWSFLMTGSWFVPRAALDEARLRGELLTLAADMLAEAGVHESPLSAAEMTDELIYTAERLRPEATLHGRLGPTAALVLLEHVPLTMPAAEREKLAIFLGLLPATPAPDGIPAAA